MTDFCDPMMKLMPAEMSQVSTPARTRWAAAGSADTTTSASAAAPTARRNIWTLLCSIAQAQSGLRLTNRSYARSRASCQVAAEALDAAASFLHVLGFGGVGNAERGTKTERRPLHHRHALGLQQFGDEVLVGDELMAARRGPAHGAGAGRIDIERRSEEHTSELQSLRHLVCRLLLEKKKK